MGEYLVKWAGLSSIWNSWEPAENLQCSTLIEQFRQARLLAKPCELSVRQRREVSQRYCI